MGLVLRSYMGGERGSTLDCLARNWMRPCEGADWVPAMAMAVGQPDQLRFRAESTLITLWLHNTFDQTIKYWLEQILDHKYFI